jgi:polygalacturonase
VSLENVALSGVGMAVADTSSATLLASSDLIGQWVVGPIYEGASTVCSFSKGGKIVNCRRHSTLLDSQGNYFERARPQYEDQAVSSFMHTKDLGCACDGSTDDTAAFQAAMYASLGKILFVDAGTYILTSIITIPSGAKIVGET